MIRSKFYEKNRGEGVDIMGGGMVRWFSIFDMTKAPFPWHAEVYCNTLRAAYAESGR